MQSLLTALASICLFVFSILLFGLTQRRPDGCTGISILMSDAWIAGLVTLCVGIAIWRADREVADIGGSLKEQCRCLASPCSRKLFPPGCAGLMTAALIVR